MRTHIANAAFGVLDYAAFPMGMLVVAPVLLHHLGAAQYGVWALAAAAVSTGGIIASGFGDANIQHVAARRGDQAATLRAVRSMMGINLVLGVVCATIGWWLSPLAATHVAATDESLRRACLWTLRLAGVLMVVRAIESVCISTQRAFERYGAAVYVSVSTRLLALAAAAILSLLKHGVVAIMMATALLMVFALCLQLVALSRMLPAEPLLPAFDRGTMRALLVFGTFTWLQAVSGVLFSQVDRLMVGVSLGSTAVATYALCAQMTQPAFGLAASGLHFLFPYLSNRRASARGGSLLRPVLRAFGFNAALICFMAGVLLLFGLPVLRIWAGATIAQGAAPMLPTLIWSSALLGLNVTGTYALLALGRVRAVTWINLASGAAMLLAMRWLTPRFGIEGVALARLGYALLSLAVYIPLLRYFLAPSSGCVAQSLLLPVCEEL